MLNLPPSKEARATETQEKEVQHDDPSRKKEGCMSHQARSHSPNNPYESRGTKMIRSEEHADFSKVLREAVEANPSPTNTISEAAPTNANALFQQGVGTSENDIRHRHDSDANGGHQAVSSPDHFSAGVALLVDDTEISEAPTPTAEHVKTRAEVNESPAYADDDCDDFLAHRHEGDQDHIRLSYGQFCAIDERITEAAKLFQDMGETLELFAATIQLLTSGVNGGAKGSHMAPA